MALSQRLEIRQSHALVMTPQLMQAIKLLQLSNLDLASYVEGELESNPLLERAGDADGEHPIPEPAVTATADPLLGEWAPGEADAGGDAEARASAGADDGSPDDASAAAARAEGELPAGYSEWSGTGSGGREDGDYNLEAFISV